MAESRQQLHAQSDEALERTLRDLGAAVAYPSAGSAPGRPDVAALARARIVERGTRPSAVGSRRFGFGVRPMRRGLVFAIAALLVLAAVAAAVGLGLPGLRIIFGEVPSQRPTATASAQSPLAPIGAGLGLGSALPLAEVERLAGFDLVLPSDAEIGPPDVVYISGQRAVLVWAVRPGLPATRVDNIGLLLSQFRGRVETGYYEKVLDSGTKLTPVTVNGSSGYWISGDPHFFYYVDPNGEFVDDTHRAVGDTLIWSTGELTYRLESGLEMAEAIRLAESLE